MSKPHERYHHGDLKTSLLEAANQILHRDGADSLSLRAIAAEVGVSHMAPYSHFKNKKELLQSVAEDGFNQMADAMEANVSHLDKNQKKNAAELILTYGATYLEFAIHNPQLYRLMLGQVETTGRKIKSTRDGTTETLTPRTMRPFTLLRAAFALGSNNEAEEKAQALGAWSMVHGMAALIIEGHIKVPGNISIKQFLAAAAPQSGIFKS
ncbi:TetR/AcrR family transcriptional regulator [Aestuariirhabdus sp. Z084]|uniref:TetR/AcrR family transcriptional regulator n=1 Tax=Aestuariirhabdus haliotis TaxID=2918751 RepID=UPI00201B395B|nr:TetR/AcrR family transcriptional regulator [Aestuariirhabdus haliotis]MCL6417750.1 TetR/AcrR family transcriptional regulator [Aestuariirhabdus haliotis]MCL6421689.1 TetR/AcrR family transcriptional regulator [Aestuariirhabdus haliotis]